MTELALIVRATAILVVCFGILGLCRRRAAALRALILTLTFAAVLLLPVAAAVLPSMRVVNPAPTAGVAMPRMLGHVAPAPIAVTIIARTTASTSPTPVLLSTASMVLLVWAVGALAFATHMFAAIWQTSRVRGGVIPWTRGRGIAQSILHSYSTTRTVDVVLAARVQAPFAFGLRRATIVFPTDANEWSDDDVRRALVHELEHIRRGDWFVLLGSRLVCTLYWFHPLVWLAWRRLRLEIERACDDAVVRVSESAAYAEQLVDLAARLSARPPVPLLSMASRSELAARIASMLDATQRRNPPARLPRVLTIGAAALVLIAAAATRVASMPIPQQDIVPPEKNDIGADVLVGGAGVSGYLYDPFGNPVEGVVVDVEWLWFGPPPPGPKQGPFARNTTTDAAGHFSFEHLRPGFYGLAAPTTDFVEAAQFSLRAGEHIERDLHMKLEPITGGFTVCRDCTVRSVPYDLPDSIAKEFDLDQQFRLTQPITGPEPAGGWMAVHPTIPEYPESLRDTNLEGTVIIEGKIGIDGGRTAMHVVSAPDPALAKAALAMLAEEAWKPAYVRSVPVEVPFREEISFVLRLPEP